MTFLLAAMQLVPLMIQLGEDLAPFAAWVEKIIAGGGASEADWTDLHAKEDALRARLNTDPAPV